MWWLSNHPKVTHELTLQKLIKQSELKTSRMISAALLTTYSSPILMEFIHSLLGESNSAATSTGSRKTTLGFMFRYAQPSRF